MLELFETNWRDTWGGAEDAAAVGAVYTKPKIVDLILDLVDYRPARGRLSELRLLEPSCGDGAFLASVLRRLIESEALHTSAINWNAPEWDACVRAIDLSSTAVSSARLMIVEALVGAGCPAARAAELSETWAVQSDFLLTGFEHTFSLVVGNPPYVRLEDLPKPVLAEYRRHFLTLKDRADLYIAFFEHGLRLLDTDGVLVYICANRFVKNQYGATLRRHISENFRVRHYINLEHTQPFVSDVSAYPAIISIDRQQGEPTLAGTLNDIEPATLGGIVQQASSSFVQVGPLSKFRRWYPGGAPWSSTSVEEVSLLAELEESFSLIEESGGATKVGIGVATGADDCFILGSKSELIEDSRQLPLLMASDVGVSANEWSGHYLVNPFADENTGKLASLEDYPGLSAHFELHATQLRGRHVAKTRPANWYRTIDRIWPALVKQPKLMIPDIQRGGVVGFDSGEFYPHHNVYWITSDAWDLRALQALLRSSQVLMQVRAFSVQMRGGSVRYQAQTLRRVRIPPIASLSPAIIAQLVAVSGSVAQADIDEVASRAFGLPVPKVVAA